MSVNWAVTETSVVLGGSTSTLGFQVKRKFRFIEEFGHFRQPLRMRTPNNSRHYGLEALIWLEVSTACVVDEARAIWADAFVVVHSILSCASFTFAKDVVQTIRGLKPSAFSPVLLLANMADLDHGRQVTAAEGRRAAVEMGCQYSEVSAAEDIGVAAAFRTFLHEVRLAQHQPRGSSLKRRRSSLATVSRRLGAMFGKKDSATGVPGASSQSCPSASGAAATAHNFNDVNAKRKGILLEPKDAVKA
ncbi:hypothetical protein EGW08_014391 [Elysia chlorotica]|uniref:small monomeric GTPase n=1 Tax=Elysia chlorotica TaxID=188477 RepID=A0A433T8B9_ELYCH|nr:hypothetical protein EGW08_014391 [Elysia chlorotica]